jgi:hypothetical protein
MPAVRIFFKFFRQVPIIVTAGKILCDAHQADFESAEITPENSPENLSKIVSQKGPKSAAPGGIDPSSPASRCRRHIGTNFAYMTTGIIPGRFRNLQRRFILICVICEICGLNLLNLKGQI